LQTTAPGARNNTLFRQTARLAELARVGLLEGGDVRRAMLAAARAAGLPGREAQATIASAFRAAARS
ncbi:MAG: bifunctional DNA primase/polymerase, partial [Candidatus Promineifilaceae bacterium]